LSPLLPDGDRSKDEREALFARYIDAAKAFKTSIARQLIDTDEHPHDFYRILSSVAQSYDDPKNAPQTRGSAAVGRTDNREGSHQVGLRAVEAYELQSDI
jgi:hypothetical protein